MSKAVYINRFSSFFPNRPVGNDEIEHYLGLITEKSKIAKRLVLNKNGITQRYYALNKSGEMTHTNTEIAAKAVRGLLTDRLTLDQIDLLSCGTTTPEQLIPSHGVMVHGYLKGNSNMEVVSFAGSCCTGMQALKYAFLSVLSGDCKRAISVASERSSAWANSRYFEKEAELLQQLDDSPILAFEKEFLRWMLSDGGVALLIENQPAEKGLSFRIDWIEITSYANQMETCMYAGGEKDPEGNLIGWTHFSETEWLNRSLFSVKQDTRILEKNIIPLGGQFLEKVIAKRKFDPEKIDWFLPHLSSMYFKNKIEEELKQIGYTIPEEKWFINLPEVGNIASASAFAMLEGLAKTGKVKKGDSILLMVPESARFSYTYAMITAC